MRFRFNLKAFLVIVGTIVFSALALLAAHLIQQPRNARALLKEIGSVEDLEHISKNDLMCKLTDQAFALMRSENVPERILKKLETLKDKQMPLADFEAEFNKAIDPQGRTPFQYLLILNHAKVKRMASFKLTDQALTELQAHKVSPELLQKLESLKDKQFLSSSFEIELNKLLTPEEKKQFNNLILDHADEERSLNQAIQLLDRYLTLNPSDNAMRCRFGELFEAKAGSKRFLAIDVYQKALARDSSLQDVRSHLAILLKEAGRFADAIDPLTTLGQESANDGTVVALLGLCYASMENNHRENLEAAIKYYKTACSRPRPDPQPEIFARLANCLLRLNKSNVKEAEATIDEMVDRLPKDFLVYLIREEFRTSFLRRWDERVKLTDKVLDDLKKKLTEDKSKSVLESLPGALESLKNKELSWDDFEAKLDALLNQDKNVQPEKQKPIKDFILAKAKLGKHVSDDLLRAKDLAPEVPEVLLAIAGAEFYCGKTDKARDELLKGRRLNPKDKRFYLALSQLELTSGKTAEAISVLRQGAKTLPEETALIVELIHQLIDVGQIEDLFKLTDQELQSLKTEMHDSMWLKLQTLKDKELSKGEFVMEFNKLDIAQERLPADKMQELQNLVLSKAEKLNGAKSTLKTASEADGNSKVRFNANDFNLLNARLDIADGNWDKALPALESQLKNSKESKSPQEAMIYLLLSRNAARLGDRDKQIRLLESSLSIKATPVAQLEYALARADVGNTELAIPELKELVGKTNPPPLNVCLALLRLETESILEKFGPNGDWSYVDKLLERARKAYPQNVMLAVTEAEIHAARGNSKNLREYLVKLCESAPHVPTPWIALVNLELRDDRIKLPGDRIKAAQSVIELAIEKGEELTARQLRILVAAHQTPADAISRIKEATDGLEKMGWYKLTERTLETLRKEKSLGNVVQKLFTLRNVDKDRIWLWKDFTNEISKVIAEEEDKDRLQSRILSLAENPNHEQASRIWGMAAVLYLKLKEYDLACKAAEQLVELHPENMLNQLFRFEVAVLAARDGLEVYEKVPGKILEAIEDIEGKAGGVSRFCQAYQLIFPASSTKKPTKEDLDNARKLLVEAENLRKNWSKIALLQAKVELLARHKARAIDHYLKAFEQGERSWEVLRQLSELYISTGKFSELSNLITNLRSKGLFSLREQQQFTEFYLQLSDFTRALETAEKAKSQTSDDPSDQVLLAFLKFAVTKKPDADIENHLLRACAFAVEFKITNETLSELRTLRIKKLEPVLVKLSTIKDKKYSRSDMEKQVKSVLDAIELKLDASVVKFDAIEVKKYQDLILRHARLAKTPAPWVARLDYLMATKQTENAKEFITKEIPNNTDIPPDFKPLILAACYESLNKIAEADEIYKIVLDKNENDWERVSTVAAYYLRTNRFAPAQPLLQRLLLLANRVPKGEFDDEEIREIRRQLAFGLAQSGNYAKCDEALKLVENNGERNRPAQEERPDALVRAAILAKQPGSKRKAIELYKTLEEDLPPESRFIYAQLLIITSGTVEGREQMTRAISDSKENPVYVEYWTRALIADKNFDEAKIWIGRLSLGKPEQWPWSVVELRTQLQQAEKETIKSDDEAEKQRKKAAEEVLGYKPKNDDEATAKARRLEELAETTSADEIFQKLIKKKDVEPLTKLAYAAFLARHKLPKNSLDLCEEVIKDGKIPAPAVAGMALEFFGHGNVEAIGRVEQWLKKVIAEKPDQPDARAAAFLLADALDRKGESNNAISTYRELLEKQPNNPLILFPLARLLLYTKPESESEVEKLLARAIAVVGPQSYLLELQAAAKLHKGDPADAASTLHRSLSEQPTASGFFLLAKICDATKDEKGAQDAYLKSKRRGFQINSLHPLEKTAYEDLDRKLQVTTQSTN
jgi:tetratricopeptide (TPR) repeat protein